MNRDGVYLSVFTCLQQAERLAERLHDHQRLGRVLGYQSLLLWATYQQQHAIAVGQRSLNLAVQHHDVGMSITAKNVLCRAYCYVGDYPRALTLCTENIETLVGDLEREFFGMAGFASVHARCWYGRICAETGAFAEGKSRVRGAIKIAKAAAHPHSLIAAYCGAGILDVRQGNVQDAAVVLERALTICIKEDIRVWFLDTASALGEVYALLGRTSEALELQKQTVEQHEFDIARRLIALGETYLHMGRLEEARQHAHQGAHLAKDDDEAGFLAWGLRLLGDIGAHGDSPDVSQAHTDYQQAITLATELGMRPLQAHCHRGLGTLYCQTGQSEQARIALSTAIEMYREMEMILWLSATEVALAQVEGKA